VHLHLKEMPRRSRPRSLGERMGRNNAYLGARLNRRTRT